MVATLDAVATAKKTKGFVKILTKILLTASDIVALFGWTVMVYAVFQVVLDPTENVMYAAPLWILRIAFIAILISIPSAVRFFVHR